MAKAAIEDNNNTKTVSIASIWEIGIKISLDKFRFAKGFKKFVEMIDANGFDILPISFEHALIVSTLEFIHRDPFDRLLIAQSLKENLTIVTRDENIKKYSIHTIW
ncbi:MAG: type II toxin-antitoxin system VapC family toxin [Prolixibacteraceae bacterium]|nr:type II toxin-antitoxin system VapC family toxin [Prolixibacteraceae bacterium]